MDIFISWSGERSGAFAQCLRLWLPKVIQSLKPWISASDVEKGARWLKEVSERLEKTNFGILCLTPESLTEPWVVFEAGALSKALGSSSVCPILLGFSPSELRGPLSQFQATMFNKTDMLKLLKSINKALGPEALQDGQLEESFSLWWPKLEQEIDRIPPPAQKSTKKRSEGDILEEILRVVRRLEEQTTPAPKQALSSRFISELLSTLTPREEKVLRMRFGIGEKADYTPEEVGDFFGLTRERIRQIETKALRKLKHPAVRSNRAKNVLIDDKSHT